MDLDLMIKNESEGKEKKYCDHCNIFFSDDYSICQKCGSLLGYRTTGYDSGDIITIRLSGSNVWTVSEFPFVVKLPDAEAGIIRDRLGAPSKASLKDYLTRSEGYRKRRYSVDLPAESIIGLYPEIKAENIKDKI